MCCMRKRCDGKHSEDRKRPSMGMPTRKQSESASGEVVGGWGDGQTNGDANKQSLDPACRESGFRRGCSPQKRSGGRAGKVIWGLRRGGKGRRTKSTNNGRESRGRSAQLAAMTDGQYDSRRPGPQLAVPRVRSRYVSPPSLFVRRRQTGRPH